MLPLPTIYWINLDRAEERRRRMLERFASHGVVHVRVPGIDGRDEGATARAIRSRARTVAEAAGIASHLTAIRRAYRDGCEHALVMEDDTTFDLYDAWPDGFAAVTGALPEGWSALALCIAEFPRHLDALFSRPGLVLPLGKRSYWSLGAYLIHRRAMAILIDRYDSGGRFDVTAFSGYHDAYWIVMRTLQRATDVQGPFVSRIPLFLFEASDSHLHPEELWEHRLARDFIRAHHAALVSGFYRSPFPLRARLQRWADRIRATVP